MATKTMDVLLIKSNRLGYESVWPANEGLPSEYVEIGRGTCTFNLIEHSEVVNKQIAALEAAKQELQAQTGVKLAAIDAQIQNLLAISHDGGQA